MDKFIIKTEEVPFELDNDLFEFIESSCKEVYVENDRLKKWDMMIKEWHLIKYQNEDEEECNCNTNNKVCIYNGKYVLKICIDCIILIPNLYKIYDNIDKIVENILDDGFYKINYDLLHFINVDHTIVDKYNKNGCKNRRNLKIYNMLCKIGEYHYRKVEFKNKLNSIYTKIARFVDINEIMNAINGIFSKIKWCKKCKPLEQCLTCFKKCNNQLKDITEEQMKALWKTYRHIFNDTNMKYGLYGSAGTGKTTLIKYILQIANLRELFLLKNLKDILEINLENIEEDKIKDYLDNCQNNSALLIDILYGEKVIVLASPTNKALDVIREKVDAIENFTLTDNYTGGINKIKVIFFTVSKLLTYRRFMDTNHNMYFKRGHKFINIIDKYNLVIIDESSMISSDNVNDISMDIDKSKTKKGFVLFTGDCAQLPPPKESCSAVFKLRMYKTELQTVMRTNKQFIIELSKFIRRWLSNSGSNKNMRKELLEHRCEYINFYTDQDKFIEANIQVEDGIILVWTNETKNKYNKKIRELLFGNRIKERFIVGEHLLFNDFYKIKIKNDEKLFYSSTKIIVHDIQINSYVCDKYDIEKVMKRVDEKMKMDMNLIDLYDEVIYERSKEYLKQFIRMFNDKMNNICKVWELYFMYRGINETEPIYVIYNEKTYKKSIEIGKKYIKDYFGTNNKNISNDVRESLNELMVEFFDDYYIMVFANVDYSYAMTVDKAQGSSFDTIFIDAPDMLDKGRYPFLEMDTAKRRFYTAITRAVNNVNILI